MSYPAKTTLPELIRGDTYRAVTISNVVINEVVPTILSSRMQLRTFHGAKVHEHTLLIVANNLTIPELSHLITETFPVGKLKFDIEITTEEYGRLTILEGSLEVKGDITYGE